MKTAFFASSLFLLALVAFPALGQSAEETAAKAAEQAGKYQVALQQYTAALSKAQDGSADDQRLREAIIRLALRLRPAPAVPEDARKYMARGMAAVEIAKTPDDLKRAAAEFQQVLLAAPWLANGYNNLAVVQEKSGDFPAAMRNFKLYLLAAPQSSDAEQVRSRIYALELKAERQKEEVAKGEQQRLARQREEEERNTRQGQIAGDDWYDRAYPTQENTFRYQVTITGNNVEIRPTWVFYRVRANDQPVWRPDKSGNLWRGTIEGLAITGTFHGDNSNFNGGGSFARPMNGSISPDGNTIRLRYTVVGPAGISGTGLVTGWRDSDREVVLRR